MKKISFLVIVTSILSACSISPQATVTPEATVALTATPTVTFTPTPSQTPTPEPTPTPDPAQIAEAGWNFVDPEAKGEIVAMFAEHGFDMDSLDFAFEDGLIRGYDAESGEMVFEDGKFDIRWAVENLYNGGDNDLFSTYDLEGGPIEPGHSSGVSQKDYNRYFLPLYFEKEEIFKPYLPEVGAFQVILDPDKLAWGQIFYIFDPETKKPGPLHYIMYEKADGELVVMEAIANMDREQIIVFNEEHDSWAKDQLSDDQ